MKTHIYFFIGIGILLASLLFRITNLNIIEFKGDEAINLFLASRPVFGHPFPPGSTISSIGVLNPPLINYLLFPLTILSTDPKSVSLAIGIINAIAIIFFFSLFRKYYGTVVMGVTTFLLALSPWSILYSRKIWAQDLLLPLLILLLYSVHKIVLEKKEIFWFFYILASLFIIQLHQPSLFFVSILTIYLFLSRPKFSTKYIFLGILLGLLPCIPYVLYQYYHACPDCSALQNAGGKLSETYDLVIFQRPFQILSQGNFRFILGDNIAVFSQDYSPAYALRKLFYVEYLILPFGMYVFWKKHKQMRNLVYCTLTLPVIYFLLRIVPHMHYFVIIIPLLFLFLGSGIGNLLSHKNPFVKGGAIISFVLLITASLVFNTAFFQFVNVQKSLNGDYGTSFEVTEHVAKKRLSKLQSLPEYQEILAASYIPRDFIYGTNPGGKMLYNYHETKKHLPKLEKRLKHVPEDARVQNELIAYYTTSPISKKLLAYLKKKVHKLPGYQVIYEEVNNLYQKQTSNR